MSEVAHPETIPIQAAHLDPSDVTAARMVNRIVGGEDVEPAELAKLPTSPTDWRGFAKTIAGKPQGKRSAARDRYLATCADRIRLSEALRVADLEPEPPEATAEPEFSLDLIGTVDFLKETYVLEYLIKGVLVKGETAGLGGPSKTLKTSIMIDEAISLASGSPFLGRFPIVRPVRVGIISGESGKPVIQANARKVIEAKGIQPEDAAGVFWGFRLPKLSEAEHLRVLSRDITNNGLDVVMLDPFYLMLLGASAKVDTNNMHEMGRILEVAANVCKDAGATPVIAHHFVKNRDDKHGPPDLNEFAGAGMGQFIRQWQMVSRRTTFDPNSGFHHLHFVYGGSAGHCGQVELNIETGVLDEEMKGRKWSVVVDGVSAGAKAADLNEIMEREKREEERQRQADEAKIRKTERNADAMHAAMSKFGKPNTINNLRTMTKPVLSNQDAKAAMHVLVEQGRAEHVDMKAPNGAKYEYFQVRPLDGSQAALNLDPE